MLEHHLYEIANNLVGSVGESTEYSYSVTGEDYVLFGMEFANEEEVIQRWKEWIGAYLIFAKCNMPGMPRLYKGEPLTIYWRKTPEIIQYEDGSKTIWARLIISFAPIQLKTP